MLPRQPVSPPLILPYESQPVPEAVPRLVKQRGAWWNMICSLLTDRVHAVCNRVLSFPPVTSNDLFAHVIVT